MKFIIRLGAMIILTVLILNTSVGATEYNNDQVLAAIKKTQLPEAFISEAEHYLKLRKLSDKEKDAVIKGIVNAQDIVDKAKVKDLNQLSTPDKLKLLGVAVDTAASIGITINIKTYGGGAIDAVITDRNLNYTAEINNRVIKRTGGNSPQLASGIAMTVLALGITLAISLRLVKRQIV